jgi:phage terminase large subunit-like protein
MPAIVDQYIEDVLTGKQVVGRLVWLAVERQGRDLVRAAASDPTFPYYFDEEAAQHILDFFPYLIQSLGRKWAGKPIVLQPWQAFILSTVFGWKRKEDGFRRFRKVWKTVARKNGKSTLAAGVGLYGLVADKEPGAEIYSAATTRAQARRIHEEAVEMTRRSKFLQRLIRIYKDNLHVQPTRSKFEPLSADYNTMDGLNTHMGFIDEVHEHKSRGTYDKIDTSTGSRSQPLLWLTTTAGFDQTSICFELDEYARKVLEQVIEDETFFAFVARIDEEREENGIKIPGDDWRDEAVWIKANPGLGITVSLEKLRAECRSAIETPAAQSTFRRYYCNQWTENITVWLPAHRWAACTALYKREDLLGQRAFGGLDVANVGDVTSFFLLFPRRESIQIDDLQNPGRKIETVVVKFRSLWWYWMPELEGRLRSRKVKAAKYPEWAEQGFVEATPGDTQDKEIVRARILEAAEKYDIQEISYDRYEASTLVKWLTDEGLVMVPCGQGFVSLSAPTKELENAVLSCRFEHLNDPVTRWMVSNVAIRMDSAGNIKPDKERSSEKIDGVVAAVMAMSRAMLDDGESNRSVYEERGVIII